MNEATVHPEKTSIRPKVEGMVKTKSGSFHKDDFLGNALAGVTVEQVKLVAAEMGVDTGKYDHLNPGQQRMNIGNRLRALTTHKEGESEEKMAEIDANRDLLTNMADGFAETNAATKAAEAAAKEEAKAAAAAAKPKKEKKIKVKEPDPVDGEGNTPD
jgi:hypothetical protein